MMAFALPNRLRSVALLLTLISMATFGHAADIRAQIDRDSPRVAEPFWLTLVVRAPRETSVIFPDVSETLGPFQVLTHRDWPDVPVGEQRQWTRHFELEGLQGGDLQIPPLAVSVDGQTLTSKAIDVSIASEVAAAADPFSFRDIKPQIDIPTAEKQRSNAWGWTVAGSLLLAALALAAWRIRREPTLAPQTWALRELERLRNSDDFRQGRAAQLVPMISNILRQYLERQFGIQATRQTTEEFLATAQNDARLSAEQRLLVRGFLQQVDEIKFAKLPAEQGLVGNSHRLVQDFVRTTSGAAS